MQRQLSVAHRPDAAEALVGFRRDLHNSVFGWADATFELCDALLCAPGRVASIPALSLEPVFRRSHGSLYKALANANIDTDWLRRSLIEHRPAAWPLVFAVDASTWDRCDAECSPERGFHYSASKHSNGQPIVAGWNYQWISQLDWAPDSWTAPLDVIRIKPTIDATTATIDQVERLAGLLTNDNTVPLFVFDAGYDPIAIGAELANVRAQILVRIRSDRVFHPDPTPRTQPTPGRPRRHGARFALSDPTTWTKPDTELVTTHPRYGNVHVQAWSALHPKLHGRGRWAAHDQPPIVTGTVIRVEVEHLPKPTARALKTLWLWWSGPGQPDLDICWRAYLRRFDIEHSFRFMKSTLGWTTPALSHPDQGDRWTWIIAAAYTQLRLARNLVTDLHLPWERPRNQTQLSPTRIRPSFHQLLPTIGTPAKPPKSHTPGPGRPKGTHRPPRTRHPAIKKTA